MPDATDPPGLISRARDWVEDSYPYAVVRRFVELELLERAVGLAAQAFIALLPLIIIIVSIFVSDFGAVVSDQVGDRFGLDEPTRSTIRQLFAEARVQQTLSLLAIVLVLVSAFALSRRLARVYAMVFEVPVLKRSQNWRGLVWIALQVVLMVVASSLRQVRDDGGVLLAVAAAVGLLLAWFLADVISLRLLVPAAPERLVMASAFVAGIGRLAMGVWAAVYFAAYLAEQAQRFGPIGVSFAIYTYLLVAVFIYIGSPLLVTTWVRWRAERQADAVSR